MKHLSIFYIKICSRVKVGDACEKLDSWDNVGMMRWSRLALGLFLKRLFCVGTKDSGGCRHKEKYIAAAVAFLITRKYTPLWLCYRLNCSLGFEFLAEILPLCQSSQSRKKNERNMMSLRAKKSDVIRENIATVFFSSNYFAQDTFLHSHRQQ